MKLNYKGVESDVSSLAKIYVDGQNVGKADRDKAKADRVAIMSAVCGGGAEAIQLFAENVKVRKEAIEGGPIPSSAMGVHTQVIRWFNIYNKAARQAGNKELEVLTVKYETQAAFKGKKLVKSFAPVVVPYEGVQGDPASDAMVSIIGAVMQCNADLNPGDDAIDWTAARDIVSKLWNASELSLDDDGIKSTKQGQRYGAFLTFAAGRINEV